MNADIVPVPWRTGDLMETSKILRGTDKVVIPSPLSMARVSKTGGHRFMVRGRRFKGDHTESCEYMEQAAQGGN